MNNEIQTISPFKNFCITVGNLPTSYLESMSYYEMLCWLCKYIENTINPAINQNAEALEELQSYVANYFDNLDVQDEINAKLDDMADSGVLAEIINVEMIGTLSNLTTTDKTDLVSAINEVNTAANLLNLNTYTVYRAANVSSLVNCTVGSGAITVATNSAGAIAKIYSDIDVLSTVDSGTAKVTIQTSLRPTSDFNINPAGIRRKVENQQEINTDKIWLTVHTDGRVDMNVPVDQNNKYFNCLLFPCIYLIKDFGDTE